MKATLYQFSKYTALALIVALLASDSDDVLRHAGWALASACAANDVNKSAVHRMDAMKKLVDILNRTQDPTETAERSRQSTADPRVHGLKYDHGPNTVVATRC